jgi:tetratricopeptide (TPR) repeat protein
MSIYSYERAVQFDPNFAIAWARLSRAHALLYFRYIRHGDNTRDAAKKALESAQKLEPNSPETLLALGYYQYWVLLDYAAAKATFGLVSKMLPSSSEAAAALGQVARREGNWEQSIAYFERGLTLDPRNIDLVTDAAWTYKILRQFPTALKLYDRTQDIVPDNPDVMAEQAGIYQAQGKLHLAAKLLSETKAQTPSVLEIRITQARLERSYDEAIRLLLTRLGQFHIDSETEKATYAMWQLSLATVQLLSGDGTGARITAEQARTTLEEVSKTQSDAPAVWLALAMADALVGEKESARNAADRAVVLLPTVKDAITRAVDEETLAAVQMILGEHSRAILTLTQLLQTSYAWGNGTPITPALLRLDPTWDPLRADPAFQKLCEEKQR